MTKAIAAAVTAICVATSATAFEPVPDGAYLRAFGSATAFLGDGGAEGPVAGLAFGARVRGTSPWRAEIEAARRKSGGDGEVGADSLMFNVIRDGGDVGDLLTSYAGAGLGAMRLKDSDGDSSTTAAGQVFVGGEFAIGGAAALTLELRYVAAGSAPGDTDDDRANWTDVTAGIVFEF